MNNMKLLLLMAVGTATALTSCTLRMDKDDETHKIEVTGSAEMQVEPDEIYMLFSLKEYLGPKNKKVQLEEIKTAFLAQCKAAGIADSNISISGYAGYEAYDYWYYRQRKSQPDFMNTISYTVKVNAPDKVDRLVERLNENAIENFYISKTSNSRMEELRKEVKKKALLAARNKAAYLAEGIGQEIGDAILVQELENSYGSYSYGNGLYSNTLMEAKRVSPATDAAGSPGFESITLRYEVKAEFSLK